MVFWGLPHPWSRTVAVEFLVVNACLPTQSMSAARGTGLRWPGRHRVAVVYVPRGQPVGLSLAVIFFDTVESVRSVVKRKV